MSRGSLRNPARLHVQAVDRASCVTGFMLDDSLGVHAKPSNAKPPRGRPGIGHPTVLRLWGVTIYARRHRLRLWRGHTHTTTRLRRASQRSAC